MRISVFLAMMLLAGPALAEDSLAQRRVPEPVQTRNGDGVYGRFDGDLALRPGLLSVYDFSAERLRPGVDLTAMFYQTAGLYGRFEQDVGGRPSTSPPVTERVIATGVILSPLFLLRFQRDAAQGAPTVELLIDSMSIEGGIVWQDVGRGLAPGGELGVRFGVPLAGRAPGPWLRASSSVRAGDFPSSAVLSLAFEWQLFVDAGLFSPSH